METFILAAISGLFIGIFSGLLGIGGGTLMIPLFRLGFGLSAISATATSLFTIIPTSLSGCITHLKHKTCIPALGLAAGIGGACTSPLGVLVANQSPGWLIMLAAACIIAYSAFTMITKALRMPKPAHSSMGIKLQLRAMASAFKNDIDKDSAEKKEPASAKAPHEKSARQVIFEKNLAVVDEKPVEMTAKRVVMGVLIGLVAGFASGYVGVGGGFLMVPLFLSVLGVSMRHASGTSLIAVTLLAIPGVITQGFLGHIDYLAGIAIAIGSIPGAMIGASLLRFIPERKLRFLFGIFLMLSAVVLAINEFYPMILGA